jgi:hypothetical protein
MIFDEIKPINHFHCGQSTLAPEVEPDETYFQSMSQKQTAFLSSWSTWVSKNCYRIVAVLYSCFCISVFHKCFKMTIRSQDHQKSVQKDLESVIFVFNSRNQYQCCVFDSNTAAFSSSEMWLAKKNWFNFSLKIADISNDCSASNRIRSRWIAWNRIFCDNHLYIPFSSSMLCLD